MRPELNWKLIKWGSGLLSLYLDARLRKQRQRRPFDIVLVDELMRSLLAMPHLKPFSTQDRQRYESVTNRAKYWHGTGILQHNKRGGTINVLARLLKQQGLRPFKDVFDIKHGEMISTSVARHRMYARIYADMHTYNGASPK